jgi:hypothetical protein
LLREFGEPRIKSSKHYGMGVADETIWSDVKRGNTVLLRIVDFGAEAERTATLVYSPLEVQPNAQR